MAPSRAAARDLPDQASVLRALVADGALPHHLLVTFLADQARSQSRLVDTLLSAARVPAPRLYATLQRLWQTASAPDPAQLPPDIRFLDRFGPVRALRDLVLPWARVGHATLVLAAYPEEMDRHRGDLTALFGPVVFALAPPAEIAAHVQRLRGASLVRRSELLVPAPESCRGWQRRESRLLAVALVGMALLAFLFPVGMLRALFAIGVLCLVPVTALKLLALTAALRPPRPESAPPTIARDPVVSVIVALYRESDIATRLVRRLSRLEYPGHLLDVILAVEADDAVTRRALSRATLPPWMRMVIVPRGRVRTKPRALNFAMHHARGSIIGVYDAEDAPEADQIRKVVDQFHRRPARVACLQGALDFYNPDQNWVARAFTLEYGGWFRVILTGLSRLGLPVPLGGTTLFFRRDALESLGGWDAHNVTEDADLGMRLYRRGFVTELIDTTTHEEANCRPLPWIKQRSRWIKGYMMTWAVHMRRPRLTRAEMGWKGFAIFQILFLGSILQALLAPVLWTGWILLFGFHHPAISGLPGGWLVLLVGVSLLSGLTNMVTLAIGLKRSGQTLSPWWIPTLGLYFPLAALASYKALWELVRRPFYWDKTAHGKSAPKWARRSP